MPTLQDVCVLTPRAYEYVTFCDKRDFVDIIMLKFEMGRLTWIIWVSSVRLQTGFKPTNASRN